MRKARNGYQLQRGVPKDVQPVIGKTIWVEGAGSIYRVAQRLSPVFVALVFCQVVGCKRLLLTAEDDLRDDKGNGQDGQLKAKKLNC